MIFDPFKDAGSPRNKEERKIHIIDMIKYKKMLWTSVEGLDGKMPMIDTENLEKKIFMSFRCDNCGR